MAISLSLDANIPHKFGLNCDTERSPHVTRSPTLEKIIERHLQLCTVLSITCLIVVAHVVELVTRTAITNRTYFDIVLETDQLCTAVIDSSDCNAGVELQKMRFAREGAFLHPVHSGCRAPHLFNNSNRSAPTDMCF